MKYLKISAWAVAAVFATNVIAQDTSENRKLFTTPAIQVLGKVDKSYSGYLGDLDISIAGQSGSRSITLLQGTLRDQSSLIGVINALYDMHLPIVSIKII